MSKDTESFGNDRTVKTPEPDEKSKSDGVINVPQIIAATGAATTGAIVASSLGIYGTIIGVAVISVISSVGTAVFLPSLNRTRDRLRQAAGHDTPDDTGPDGAASAPDTTVTATASTATTGIRAAAPVPTPPTYPAPSGRPPGRRRTKWHAMVLMSAIVFVLSLGTLTGIALLSGQSPAKFYGNSPVVPASVPPEPSEFGPDDQQPEAPPPSPSPDETTTPDAGTSDETSPSDPTTTPSPTDTSPPAPTPSEPDPTEPSEHEPEG